jgi:hypothetical protein
MQLLAAKALGCSHETVQQYIKKFPTVRQVAEQLRGELVDLAELRLWEALEHGEPWAISLVLKTLGKPRGYVERDEMSPPTVALVRVVYDDNPMHVRNPEDAVA